MENLKAVGKRERSLEKGKGWPLASLSLFPDAIPLFPTAFASRPTGLTVLEFRRFVVLDSVVPAEGRRPSSKPEVDHERFEANQGQ